MKKVLSFLAVSWMSAAVAQIQVTGPESPEVIVSETREAPPSPGNLLALRSKTPGTGIVGFAEVLDVTPNRAGVFTVRAKLLRLTGPYMLLAGDTMSVMDLRSLKSQYPGHTELLVRDPKYPVSARFRPLYTQGFSIGETAHTLSRNELLVGIYGQFSYGLFDRFSVGTFVPGLFLSSPNANVKGGVFESTNNTVAAGMTVTKIRDSSSTAVNLSIFWDSVTSTRMTTHTLLTVAVATLEKVEDTVAIKTAGTSSLQTGYEVLLENWDRVLFGPSYNFESKTVGGYLAYKRIWENFHLSGSLSTVNIRELKYAPKTAYVALVEAYWRY